MTFFLILERLWIAAVAAALVVFLYNLFVTSFSFDESVYVPLLCAVFAFAIYYNIHRQRIFLQQRKNASQ